MSDADMGQETVDKSPTFSEMLVDLEKWMNKWDLLDERGALKDAVWVSDGVSDRLAEKRYRAQLTLDSHGISGKLKATVCRSPS
jgi:inhibitor of KinA sporulation pathway (predicted exonuclease)